jgi:hypothetical protein
MSGSEAPCTFIQLVFTNLPYLIVGAVALIGATLIILKKAGLLVLKSNNNNNRSVCSSHMDCINSIENIERKQSEMAKQQELNMKALSEGKKEFEQIKAKINNLRVGVAILLDRSGGTTKEFDDIVIDNKGG